MESNSSNSGFRRPPRVRPSWLRTTVDLPEPPQRANNAPQQNWLALVAPLLSAGVLITAITFVGVNSNIAAMAVPMVAIAGTSVIISLITTFLRRRRTEQEFLRRKELFVARYDEVCTLLADLHKREIDYREMLFPHPSRLLFFAGLGGMTAQQEAVRLWERRRHHEDFLTLRIGSGSVAADIVIQPPPSRVGATALPHLFNLVRYYSVLPESPILIPLKDVGSIGIAGDPTQILSLVYSLLWQIVTLHAPEDVRVALLSPNDSRKNWRWVSDLPHSIPLSNDRSQSVRMVTSDQQRTAALLKELRAELSRRRDQRRPREREGVANDLAPLLPIVLFIDQLSAFGDARLVLDLVTLGPECQIYTILIGEAYWHTIPGDFGSIIDVTASGMRWAIAGGSWTTAFHAIPPLNVASDPEYRTLRDPTIELIQQRHSQTHSDAQRMQLDTFDFHRSERLASRLGELGQIGSGSQELPRSVRLFDLLGIATRQDLLVPATWQEPLERPWRPVPIGQMPSGRPLELDLFQEKHGPHGIIAGATGAGKSVLLQSIIAALAVKHSPLQLQLLLIDFKGGASLAMLSRLPHCGGFVTDLEGRMAERAITAIKSELRYRKSLFRQAEKLVSSKVEDISEYRSKHEKHQLEGIPNLLIIIDEFDEMVQSYREFVAELVRVVKQGRSLGIHLLVASQQPAKAVTDDIRTQLKFFISLRLGSGEDSRVMTLQPDAAFLPTDIPGRAYFRVGAAVELFQAAQVVGPYRESQQGVRRVDRALVEEIKGGLDVESDLDVLIRSLRTAGRELFDRMEARPRAIWQEPLPSRLHLYQAKSSLSKSSEERSARGSSHPTFFRILDGLVRQESVKLGENARSELKERLLHQSIKASWASAEEESWLQARIGRVDIPQLSLQEDFYVSLHRSHLAILGVPGSGKTMLLRSLLLSLALTHSPEDLWMYLIDTGGQGLNGLAALPHVGAWIPLRQREEIRRLLYLIDAEIQRRQVLFRQYKAPDLMAYRRATKSREPAWIVVIDKIALLREEFKDRNGVDTIIDVLLRLARVSHSYGIHFIFSADSISTAKDLPYPLLSLCDERIALRLSDLNMYSDVIGTRVTMPILSSLPGRGLVVQRERGLVEIQVALPLIEIAFPDTHTKEALAEAEIVLVPSIRSTNDEQAGVLDDEINDEFEQLVDQLASIWTSASTITTKEKEPQKVGQLEEQLSLDALGAEHLVRQPSCQRIQIPLGKDHWSLSLDGPVLDSGTPHCAVLGLRRSGKTTTLRSIITVAALRYAPEDLRIVIIEPRSRGLSVFHSLGLAHLEDYASDEDEIPKLANRLHELWDDEKRWRQTRWLVIVDDHDIGHQTLQSQFRSASDRPRNLAAFLKKAAFAKPERNIHLVIAATVETYPELAGELVKIIDGGRQGIVLNPGRYQSTVLLSTKLPYESHIEQSVGRALLVREERNTLIQVARALDTELESMVTGLK